MNPAHTVHLDWAYNLDQHSLAFRDGGYIDMHLLALELCFIFVV